MASRAKSCSACQPPPQHPRRRKFKTSAVSAPQSQTEAQQHNISHSKNRCRARCSALSGQTSIVPPTVAYVPALSTTAESAFTQQRVRGKSVVDVVMITRARPYTVASLAAVENAASASCRFPGAAVYMNRATYNEICESVAQQKSGVGERAFHALEQIFESIHIFDHSWTIAPGLTVSSISTPDRSQPADVISSIAQMAQADFMRTPAPLCDDSPVHIMCDAPVTLTKGVFVGCTQDESDPWFRLNHDVDQRAGAAGRAKLLKTVATGGSMHVFYDAAPANAETLSNNDAPATFRKVQWHAAPVVQRFCPANHR